MIILIAVVGGWVVLAFAVIAAVWWIGKLFLADPREGEHERGWTVEELRAIRGATPLAPILTARAERLPFEDEYDAPARARSLANRRYDDLISWWNRQPAPKETSQ